MMIPNDACNACSNTGAVDFPACPNNWQQVFETEDEGKDYFEFQRNSVKDFFISRIGCPRSCKF